ncbi:hypothetical protein [Virgibacillus halodenitrificans]|uniref:hypothetical protein n=1 Tax=Virgibacillus halodenitrificans TaxID=1482 RepID=UPI001F2CDBDE|nr:hypothetical protein [Virgibacillus halodenitrificans]
MQLIYKDEQYEVGNNEAALNMILEKINEAINEEDVVFSHLLIDRQEVYENHEAYILDHLTEIMEIEIVTKSTRKMIVETMVSINEYLERAIPALHKLIENSYDGFTNETWEGINQLGEGMQWITQFVTFTKAASQHPASWTEIEKAFQESQDSFSKLVSAMEDKDTVLISDILAYEVVPAYEDLEGHLKSSLQDRESFTHVN